MKHDNVNLGASFDKHKEVNQLLANWKASDDWNHYVFVRDQEVFEERWMSSAEADYRKGSNTGPEPIIGGYWELYSEKHDDYTWL